MQSLASMTTVRDQSLQLLTACKQNSTPPLVGCTSRLTPRSKGWAEVGFDDSRWDYSMEFSDAEVRWGLPCLVETLVQSLLQRLMTMETRSKFRLGWIKVYLVSWSWLLETTSYVIISLKWRIRVLAILTLLWPFCFARSNANHTACPPLNCN